MITIIKNDDELKDFIAKNSDYDPEIAYIAINKENKECFAITGCTYASEAFLCVNDEYSLVITDDDYIKEINEQLNSKHPELNPFFL